MIISEFMANVSNVSIPKEKQYNSRPQIKAIGPHPLAKISKRKIMLFMKEVKSQNNSAGNRKRKPVNEIIPTSYSVEDLYSKKL